MHYILYITVIAEDEEVARERVFEWMEYGHTHMEKESVTIENQWDWWYFGDRYSGHLLLAYEFIEDYRKILREKEVEYGMNSRGVLYSGPQKLMDKQEELHKDLDVWWSKNVPEAFASNPCPRSRDSFQTEGYSDDVLMVDKELYNEFLKDITEPTEWRTGEFPSLRFVDLDQDSPSEDFIGKKWIVLIDAHI